MTNQKEQESCWLNMRGHVLKRLLQVAVSVILLAVILFVSAGSIDWPYAWIYIVTTILIITVNAFIFPPELISERGMKKENVEKGDKLISGLIMFGCLALYTASGTDIRFQLTPEFAPWIHMAGLIIFILANVLLSWAVLSNMYFSTAVRIQLNRDHKVSAGGPYRFMRHPGYLGMIIYNLFTPVILGSVWALIPAVFIVIMFVVRTAFEDNMLKNKLEGYKEYAEKVKYRLIPGIW